MSYEVGRALVVMLGAFRPVLGAIFGTATFFALESGVFQPTPDTDATAFFYYPLFAFAAGFSERYAHVIMGDADLSVARALTGAGLSNRRTRTVGPRGRCGDGPGTPSGAPAHRAGSRSRRSAELPPRFETFTSARGLPAPRHLGVTGEGTQV